MWLTFLALCGIPEKLCVVLPIKTYINNIPYLLHHSSPKRKRGAGEELSKGPLTKGWQDGGNSAR